MTTKGSRTEDGHDGNQDHGRRHQGQSADGPRRSWLHRDPHQREAIERWAEYKKVRIAAWHVDEDESGGTHKRPGLEAAVERALAGETGGIVSWKIDRFSRYTEGGLQDLRRLDEAGARLAFVAEDIDTSGPMGRFVYTIMLAMSEYLLDTIKAGWRTSKMRATKRGAKIARANFGYRRRDDGTLEINEAEAEVVLEAFTVCAGDGISATVKFLRDKAPERTWTVFTVKRTLAAKQYLGEIRHGDNDPFHDEALRIVPRGLFEQVKRILDRPVQRRAKPADFPLSGLAECGSCGGRMVGGRGGPDARRMYRCATRCDGQAAVGAERLEKHVVGLLREAFTEPAFKVGGESVEVIEAEVALADAEAELDAFASDVKVRRLLGDRYHRNLERRVDAVNEARERLGVAMDATESAHVVVPAELWDSLEPSELAEVLRSGLDTLVVGRGYRPLADKVRVGP
jgi:site-specific DNA recombinase